MALLLCRWPWRKLQSIDNLACSVGEEAGEHFRMAEHIKTRGILQRHALLLIPSARPFPLLLPFPGLTTCACVLSWRHHRHT